ncbi:MAG: glycogen/starch/alpha-glucan phosphorylase, partial [Nanoarchaeota archaeon]
MEEVDFKKQKIAYFSMEIALDSKIPTYSGGLGVLAGDYLRSACDLEVPVIGITLLYKKGYFHQAINNEGYQEEHDEIWDPFDYLEKLKNTVKIKLFNREVTVACWLYRLKGLHQTNPIIFLDTDLDENSPEDREITKKLYGTGQEYRILQEAVLGMAGT